MNRWETFLIVSNLFSLVLGFEASRFLKMYPAAECFILILATFWLISLLLLGSKGLVNQPNFTKLEDLQGLYPYALFWNGKSK